MLTLDEQNKSFLFDDRDKNIRDVLIHLFEWHQLLIIWITENKQGVDYPFLPAPYNWKTYLIMNNVFWQKHQTTDLETAKNLLNDSHAHVIEIIEGFTDDELFIKKYYRWTGSTHLGSYAISATSSHYDWAYNKIKKQLKLLK